VVTFVVAMYISTGKYDPPSTPHLLGGGGVPADDIIEYSVRKKERKTWAMWKEKENYENICVTEK
jgi:hypothetical protein